LTILAQPAVPTAAAQLLDFLAVGEARTFAALGEKGRLKPGTALPASSGVFPRWVDPEEAARRAGQPKPEKAAKQQKKPKDA
jgi:methionyl-tRNA synthetase